jgi:hypothetical protein
VNPAGLLFVFSTKVFIALFVSDMI